MVDRLADVRALFRPASDITYLDAATYGLPPQPTVDAMHTAIDGWQAGTADWVRAWDQCGEPSRAYFARLIGGPADAVGLVPTVSVAVGVIAGTLEAEHEVVVPEDEFTSVLFPLLVAQRHRGVRVRTAPFDELANAVTPSTQLVAFSLVQSQSGRVAPLADILAASRAVGARTLVDATHAVPFVDFSRSLTSIDYLLCAAYKHLLCPRGVAFMYVAPERWDLVPPFLANWRSAADPYGRYYGGPLNLAPTAARFDVSLAWFSWAGASVSLRLIADWHTQGLLEEVNALARRLAGQLGLPDPLASLVSVPVADAEGLRERLSQAGVKAAVRAGSVRLSPHVYNTLADVDRAAELIAPFVQVAARP